MSLNKSIVIVGFGSQAKAWALNLKDSKCSLKIALAKSSPSQLKAQKLGFDCINLESDDLKAFDIFVLLIPDDQHGLFLKKSCFHPPTISLHLRSWF